MRPTNGINPPNIRLIPFSEIEVGGFELYKVSILDEKISFFSSIFEDMFRLLKPDPDFDFTKLCIPNVKTKNFFELHSKKFNLVSHGYFCLVVDARGQIMVHCFYHYSAYGFCLQEHAFNRGISHIPGYTRILIVPKAIP